MEWLYPELKRTNPNDRSSALREAKASSFGAIELVGISIALVLAVVVAAASNARLHARVVSSSGKIARIPSPMNFRTCPPSASISSTCA